MRRCVIIGAAVAVILSFAGLSDMAYAGVIDYDDGSPEFPENILEIDILELENPNTDNEDVEITIDYIWDVVLGEELDFNAVLMFKYFEDYDPVDLVFSVEDSGGTAEYLFAEGLINDGDTTWLDFHVELGTGVGKDFERLSASQLSGQGLDFDTPDTATPDEGYDPFPGSAWITPVGDGFVLTPVFLSVDPSEDMISWYNGEIPPFEGEEDNLLELPFIYFSIDVPDGVVDEFTLRQYPTRGPVIPEPGTFLLLGAGLLGTAALRKKKT